MPIFELGIFLNANKKLKYECAILTTPNTYWLKWLVFILQFIEKYYSLGFYQILC